VPYWCCGSGRHRLKWLRFSPAPTTDKGTFYNVTFERRYKDGDQWKSSHSYNAGDLLELAKAADMAHTKIVEGNSQESGE
jgi:hypothetical protein